MLENKCCHPTALLCNRCQIEKTLKQVSEEKTFPISTIYYYLKRFRDGGGDTKLPTIAVELQWWTTDVESVVVYTICSQAQFGLEPTMIA